MPIAHFDLRLHPVREDILEDGGADIADPLLAHLMDLLVVRHIVKYVLVVVFEEESDFFERQAFILGHLYVSDCRGKDTYGRE